MKIEIKKTINSQAMKNLEQKLSKKISMQVGWFPSAKYQGEEDGAQSVTVASVACKNEFGEGTIPARPFMRPTAKNQSKAWAKKFAQDIKNNTVENAFNNLGFMVEGDVRKTIANVWEPPLSLTTIYNRLMKHSSLKARTPEKEYKKLLNRAKAEQGTKSGIAKPLIDTGYMIESITHEVKNG